MKAIYLEDCRRIFIAALKLVYKNDKEDRHTYALAKNRERSNLPDNNDDIIVVPSKVLTQAIKVVVTQMGLHPEQANGYRETFCELGWIIRPKDKNHRFKTSMTDRRKFHGKDTAVYLIDRIKFDLLCDMNGMLVKDAANNPIAVPLRTPDGDILISNGNSAPTTITYGLVQDARYNQVSDLLDKKIEEKDSL